jgi:phosphoenolpyruvate phosphomutase
VKVTTMLRNMLNSSELSFVMEGHNALSAKIAEQAGFKAIWASGLSISASMGLSDRNEASWTQVVEIVEHMADHVNVPVLVDGDSGFGNFNNVARLVRKLGQRGVAGVCLEDKLFPKQNSFIGEAQALESVSEFSAKIRSAKDAQLDADFSVVARVEALIAGHSMDEALDRAEAYCEAGADAILIHSKKSTGDEIIEFAKRWDHRRPLVIVPTKYYNHPTSDYTANGISSVIWANHSLRASITAMQSVTRQIMSDHSVGAIEKNIATLPEVFKLTNEYEVQAAEKKYFQSSEECV